MAKLRIDELEATQYFTIPNTLVQPDASTSAVINALQELDTATATLLSANGADSLAFNLWTAIFDIIVPRTTPAQQSKLVDFVIQLQKKTVNNPTTGEVLKSDGQVLWIGIPWLHLAAVDAWDVSEYPSKPGSADTLYIKLIYRSEGPGDHACRQTEMGIPKRVLCTALCR